MYTAVYDNLFVINGMVNKNTDFIISSTNEEGRNELGKTKDIWIFIRKVF